MGITLEVCFPLLHIIFILMEVLKNHLTAARQNIGKQERVLPSSLRYNSAAYEFINSKVLFITMFFINLNIIC